MTGYDLFQMTYFAFMGFGFLIVGASFANWSKDWVQVLVGIFIFVTGCMFTTAWAVTVVKHAINIPVG